MANVSMAFNTNTRRLFCSSLQRWVRSLKLSIHSDIGLDTYFFIGSMVSRILYLLLPLGSIYFRWIRAAIQVWKSSTLTRLHRCSPMGQGYTVHWWRSNGHEVRGF